MPCHSVFTNFLVCHARADATDNNLRILKKPYARLAKPKHHCVFWSCSDLSWLLYTADYCHTLSVGIWKKMLWRLGLSAGPFTTQWLHKTEFSLLREDSKALRSRFVKALHACWLPCRRHRRAADGWDHGEAVCKRYVVDSARFGIIRGWDGKASKPGAAVVARPRQQRFDRRGVVRRSADGASSLQQFYFIYTAAAAVAGAATAAAAQTEEILNHCMNLNLMSPHSLSQKVTQYIIS